MITYKFFRDKFFILSDKPQISPFGKIPNYEQIDLKPVGLWFSKGLQWLNLMLNSYHELFTDPSYGWSNKTLYLHQIDINWDQILQVNNEKKAIELSAEFADNIDFNIWMEYIERHPEYNGIYCKLNNKYNIEKYSRRGPTNYKNNTEKYEARNIKSFGNAVTRYININNPSIYDIVTEKELEKYYLWYPILSIDSGCIWNDKAVNFDKCKLVLEIPYNLLKKCKNSQNSIQTLLYDINKYNMIEDTESIDNTQPPLNNIFRNSGSRTKKSGSSGRRRSQKATNSHSGNHPYE